MRQGLDSFSSGVATVAVLTLFLMRPSYLGESLALPGTLLLIFAAALSLTSPSGGRGDMRGMLLMAGSILVLWLYLLIHALVQEVISPFPFYSFILAASVAGSALILLSVRRMAEKVRQVFVSALAYIGLSSGITAILLFILPEEAILLFNVPSETYSFTGNGDVYFPLSMTYTWTYGGLESLPRFNHFWRESGIAQAIYAWAFLMAATDPSLKSRRTKMLGIIVGVLTTFSTPAYASIGVVIGAYVLFFRDSRRLPYSATVLITALLVAVLVWFSVFDQTFGLIAKVNSPSFYDRFYAIQVALLSLRDNPWGYGIYNPQSQLQLVSAINLLGQSAFIGVMGFLLVCATWLVLCISTERRLLKTLALLPIIVNAMLFQPLLDAMGIFFIMMLPPPSRAVSSNRERSGREMMFGTTAQRPGHSRGR
jgi:hypothetical protein